MISPAVAPLALLLAALAAPALAHTGAGPIDGFAHGLLHPLGGLDHLLAMVAVGLWAGLIGGRARLAYPAAFLFAMALAGLWGMSGAALPGVEIGIAVSVVVLGAAIALAASPPLAAGAAACAIFAIFHGFAHGAELPASQSGLGYAAGFMLATAALHGAGLLLAALFAVRMPALARMAGGGLALAGLALLAG
jgi:urease accessory protein